MMSLDDIDKSKKNADKIWAWLTKIEEKDNDPVLEKKVIKFVDSLGKKDLLTLIDVAGVQKLFFGLESGSDKILKEFGKGLTVKDNITTLLLLFLMKHYKIDTQYIASSPKSNMFDFIKTLRLILINCKLLPESEIVVNPYVIVCDNTPICTNPKPRKNQRVLHPKDTVLKYVLKQKAIVRKFTENKSKRDEPIFKGNEFPAYLLKAISSIETIFKNYEAHIQKNHFKREYT